MPVRATGEASTYEELIEQTRLVGVDGNTISGELAALAQIAEALAAAADRLDSATKQALAEAARSCHEASHLTATIERIAGNAGTVLQAQQGHVFEARQAQPDSEDREFYQDSAGSTATA